MNNLKKLGTATDYVEYKEHLTYGAKATLKQIDATTLHSINVTTGVDVLGNPTSTMSGKIVPLENTKEFVLLKNQIVNLVENGKALIKDGISAIQGKSKEEIIKDTTVHNENFEAIIDEFLKPIQEETIEVKEKK